MQGSQLVIGILAHVDAGKTTLSEALLYTCGALRRMGRVDHGDAFLDTFSLERQRGITIFSKQASLCWKELPMTLLDTPGHVDFSAEMERTLQVLDYAILVVSGSDGIQGHTRTLWRLLEQYGIPVFLFVNKMDQPGADKRQILRELQERFGDNCLAFGPEAEGREDFREELSMCGEELLEEYLEKGTLQEASVAAAVARRQVFPCYFGSALLLEGVEELLEGIRRFALLKEYPEAFGARVYKISRDGNGNRLTHLKVTGGVLRVKMPLGNKGSARPGEAVWEEKADQLRIYGGAQYKLADQVGPGGICAVTGLDETYAGQGLGAEGGGELPVLVPVLTYRMVLPEGYDPLKALGWLQELEEEDPELHVVWKEASRQIHVQVMGEVQIEILKSLILERHGCEVEFGAGSIVYKETIGTAVVGIGHFEPLRHYAEVHLLLEPGEPGSGLQFATACKEDDLDRNWQRLILTHLEEKTHLGVLTGSPVTDMKITLLAGRAHLKHTEGGDFRQATYRALRQGLMQAASQGEGILLEPVFSYTLEVPSTQLGRAMSDIQKLHGRFDPPVTRGEHSILRGSAPASTFGTYQREVTAYTRGEGRLSCVLKGYEPCHNPEEVVAAMGYDPEADVENPASSVFCAHGSGFLVGWEEVPGYAHVDSGWKEPSQAGQEGQADADGTDMAGRAGILPGKGAKGGRGQVSQTGNGRSDYITQEEIEEIFKRTYGKEKQDFEPYRYHHQNLGRGVYGGAATEGPEKTGRDSMGNQKKDSSQIQGQRKGNIGSGKQRTGAAGGNGQEYFLVDGYNIIFAWEDLRELAAVNIDSARDKLMDICSNFQGCRGCTLILVFDAYKVKGNPGSVRKYHNIYVVYTREAETADQYIEKTVHDIGKKHLVTVATSDALEQMIIWGEGALRMSAPGFRDAVETAAGQMREFYEDRNRARGV